MTLQVVSNKARSGIVKEQLPAGFEALTPLSWEVDLTPDEPTTLTYTYRAPKISPAIFELGPLIVGDYQELRSWSLASDATFQMQTGYYIGDGADDRAITEVGFQPQLVLIKDDTGNGTDGVNWKSSAMSGETSSVLADTDVDVASNAIQSLDSDGFTLGTDADVNAANIRFVWIAFSGSDCTSSGTFCVGSYTGNNGASQAITTVGFQPNYVGIKSSSGTAGSFMTSSMATNVSQRYDNNNETTDGTRIKSLDATGFTVGNLAAVNDIPNTYWFFAFKTTTGAFAEGTYTGNGTTQSPTVEFRPNYVMVKIANGTAGAAPAFNQTESNSDYSGSIADGNNTVDWIKSLDSNGFTVGAAAQVNENTKTLYWIAFGGAPSHSPSGTFKMATGSYSGNGSTQSITGLGFAPDLVIIKDESGSNYGVFRTRLSKGDLTHYIISTIANFTGGITSLDSDGFSVGSTAPVNTNSTVYTYQAFGNAFNPETGSGASDFTIGAYTGNDLDDRNILRLPFQPDVIVSKRSANTAIFKTSEMTGDSAGYFTDNAEAVDLIQAINSDGFQVGTNGQINNAGSLHHFFAFKSGNSLKVESYSGTGSAQDITAPGFSPDLVWVKSTAANYGVMRPSTNTGDLTQWFANVTATTDRITALISNGFSIGGNQAQTNTSGTTYRYATWIINTAPATPSLDAPTDTATNQSVTPALKTTTTDTSSDYLRYKIQLCENVGMSTNCQTFDQTSSQTGWSGQNAQTSTAYTSGTQGTYTIQTPLTAGTTYYWRSYAIDPGGTNTWSSTQGTPYSFTTSSGINNFNFEELQIEGVNLN